MVLLTDMGRLREEKPNGVDVESRVSFSHVVFEVDCWMSKGLMVLSNSWIYNSKGMSKNRARDSDSGVISTFMLCKVLGLDETTSAEQLPLSSIFCRDN